MSRTYRFRIVNVFALDEAISRDRKNQNETIGDCVAQHSFTGNPLAVIEDARGLSDAEMQQIALQFNLSETTFIFASIPERENREAAILGRTSQFSSEQVSARVRIFTPTLEMPFAGHPTLGSAYVVRALGLGGDQVNLDMKAGVISVQAGDGADRDVWTLTANAATHRNYEFTRVELAQALGIEVADIAGDALWMNAGVEQLIVPLTSAEAVARVRPRLDAALLYCRNFMEAQAYVFAHRGDHRIVSRYFFEKSGAMIEDPGTGSACANLGGYFLTNNMAAPFHFDIEQGAATGRSCLLHLTVDTDRHIHVGGRVIELGHGELTLD